MSLNASFQIGRSALVASQLAIQVAGQNLANAATPGHSRQVARLVSLGSSSGAGGANTGRGVRVIEVQRQIDTALQARLEDSVSREQAALIDQQVLSQIESIINELSDTDLSSELTKFFNVFSELANNPSATETRAVAIEQGVVLSSFIRGLNTDLTTMRAQIDSQIATRITKADEILSELATVNDAIVSSEQGIGNANELRDRRDALVSELSQLIDVSTIQQPNGAVDVLVGSTPILLAGTSRGLGFRQETINGELQATVYVKQTNQELDLTTGSIGAFLQQRERGVNAVIDDLNSIASNLIFEVNRLHTAGSPVAALTDLTGYLPVPVADRTLALNDPNNATFDRLPFEAVNGAFNVIVSDGAGNRTVTRIEIDLDGIDGTGAAGFGDDTSLEDIRASLDAIPNLNAEITPSGRLRVYTDSGFEVSFGDDSSGALAVLGVNSYFSGTDASNMDVREDLQGQPLKLVAGFERATNEVALAISALRDAPVSGLGGLTVRNSWLSTVERIGVEGAAANTRVASTQLVRESLDAQRGGISGVSIDEESLNLLSFQRQYQGAARFITVVDEMLQTLIALV